MPRKVVKKKRQQGTGGVRQEGAKWHIRWYGVDGKRKELVAGKTRESAEQLLRQKIAEVDAARLSPERTTPTDITVGDCLQIGLADAKHRQLSSVQIMTWRIGSSLAPLESLPVMKFTYQTGLKYIADRRKEVSDATINRELSQLRASFRLAASERYRLIPNAPEVPHLDEPDNVRTGFLHQTEYERLRDVLPDDLRGLFICAYYTGMRCGSLLKLKLAQVDLADKKIWVRRTQVKNKKSQAAPIVDGDMLDFCTMAVKRNKEYLFEWYHCKRKTQRGKPIKNFKEGWKKATLLADLPNLNFHDLRRTAVRDWIRAGVPESAVMLISGHKTRSMLDRYNIMDAETVTAAAATRRAFDGKLPPTQNIAPQSPVHVGAKWGEEEGKKPS